jgi:hypothetical protein
MSNSRLTGNLFSRAIDFIRASSTKAIPWLLCIGILINVWVLFATIRLATFLFYLNPRYWSVSTFVILWLIAIWLISEVLDLADNYHQIFRYVIGIACLFTVSTFFVSPNSSLTQVYAFSISAVAIAVIRSIALFYDYRHGQIEGTGLEEAKWFWSMTGFMAAACVIAGLMQVFTIRIEISPQRAVYMSLWTYFRDELQQTFKSGDGAIVVRLCCFMAFLGFLAFLFTIYKWVVSFTAKIREG